MAERKYYVYIMTNPFNTVLYTGVTNNLCRRVNEHKGKIKESFTKRYNVNKLVYFEEYGSPMDAIRREKQIKAGPRKKKVELVKSVNPDFKEFSIW
jgi:putative endonuclease